MVHGSQIPLPTTNRRVSSNEWSMDGLVKQLRMKQSKEQVLRELFSEKNTGVSPRAGPSSVKAVGSSLSQKASSVFSTASGSRLVQNPLHEPAHDGGVDRAPSRCPSGCPSVDDVFANEQNEYEELVDRLLDDTEFARLVGSGRDNYDNFGKYCDDALEEDGDGDVSFPPLGGIVEEEEEEELEEEGEELASNQEHHLASYGSSRTSFNSAMSSGIDGIVVRKNSRDMELTSCDEGEGDQEEVAPVVSRRNSKVALMGWAEALYSQLLPSVGGVLQSTLGNAAYAVGSLIYNAGSNFASEFLHPKQLYPKEDVVKHGNYKIRVFGNQLVLRGVFFNNDDPATALRLVVQVASLAKGEDPTKFVSSVRVEEISWTLVLKGEKGLVQVKFRNGVAPKGTRFYPPIDGGILTIDLPAN